MHGTPIVIAHRGASGYAPEHTLAAYFIAMQQGAHYIEPDLVMTRDGVLVARHENEISQTTDVAQHPQFAQRRTRKTIDGVVVEGWFTEDFTLAELKRLRAVERLRELRSCNARFDRMFAIPTLDGILTLGAGLPPVPSPLVRLLPRDQASGLFPRARSAQEGWLGAHAAALWLPWRGAPVFIQSFETGNLRLLRTLTE